MIKKILGSRILRIMISLVLIYFAFKKVDVLQILKGLGELPFRWIILNIIFTIFITLIGAYRWSLLLLKKIGFREFFDFIRASYLGFFYGVFFPSSVVGDLLKLVPLKKKFPEFTKVRLLSSALLDRIIGLTAFMLLAFVSACVAKFVNFNLPDYLFPFFSLMFIGVVIFYILIMCFDIEKIIQIIIKKIVFLNKFKDFFIFLEKENKKRILLCLLLSIFAQVFWVLQVWFVSIIFNAGFSMLSVFVFMPIIALILVLPISVAGFGAREQLYLFFFSQVATGNESTLLVSTFLGIIGLINSLIGGLFVLF